MKSSVAGPRVAAASLRAVVGCLGAAEEGCKRFGKFCEGLSPTFGRMGSVAQGDAKKPFVYVVFGASEVAWERWGMKGLARRRTTTRPSDVQETTASSSTWEESGVKGDAPGEMRSSVVETEEVRV